MTLSSTFSDHQLRFRVDGRAVGGDRQQHIERQHARLRSRDRESDHDNPTAARKSFRSPAQANAALAGPAQRLDLEVGGAEAISAGLTTLAQTVDDSVDLDLAAAHAERRFAVGDDRQLAERSWRPTRRAEQHGGGAEPFLRRRRTSPRRSMPARQRLPGAGAGRPGHGELGEHDQQSARPVRTGQQCRGLPGWPAAPMCRKPRTHANSILTQLSQQVGISTTTNSNGSMSIYTESGVTLFQEYPQTVSFTPTATYARARSATP